MSSLVKKISGILLSGKEAKMSHPSVIFSEGLVTQSFIMQRAKMQFSIEAIEVTMKNIFLNISTVTSGVSIDMRLC